MGKFKEQLIPNQEKTEFKNLAVFVIINKRVKSIYEVISENNTSSQYRSHILYYVR